MQLEMQVTGLMLDPLTNMPIVILKDENSDKILPIWVGVFEANAIAMKRDNIEPPRPMTHDLIKGIIEGLGVSVLRIVINDLKDSTFFALIYLDQGGHERVIDSRPSDAIALALRTDSPIFVEEEVIEKAASLDIARTPDEAEARLKKWFESVDPEDFSKYEM